MRFATLVIAAATLLIPGCTHHFLRHAATTQAGTVNDVYFQQVVENLAAFHCNPGTLPQFAVLNDGTSQVTDQGQFSNTGLWGRLSFTSYSATLLAQRALQENWKLAPVNVPGRIRRMRCAFQLVTSAYPAEFTSNNLVSTAKSGTEKIVYQLELVESANGTCIPCIQEMIAFGLLPSPESLKLGKTNKGVFEFDAPDKRDKFHAEFMAKFDCNFPRCWYGITPRREVPKNACYVADCCDNRLWVDTDGIDALSRFTITVLSLALTDPPGKSLIIVERQFQSGTEYWKVSGQVEGRVLEFGADRIERELAKLTEAAAALMAEASRVNAKSFTTSIAESLRAGTTHEERAALIKSLRENLPKALTDDKKFDDAAEAYLSASERLDELKKMQSYDTATQVPTSPFDRPVNLPLSRPTSGIEVGPPSLPGQ